MFFEGCCRLSAIDNNANLPFYLSSQVQIREAITPELAPPRSSAQFSHPDIVVLRRNGDYFVNDGPDAGTCKVYTRSDGSPIQTSFQMQAYHMEDAYKDKLRYRLATQDEMGLYKCRPIDRCTAEVSTGAKTFSAPPDLTINSVTGVVTMVTGSFPLGHKYDGPGHGTWAVTVIVETLQCSEAKTIGSCPNPQPYITTVDFLLNIKAADVTPIDASQPRPYMGPLVASSLVTSRDNPIITRCGISPELSHFDVLNAATGTVTTLGNTITLAFYDPDHNMCIGPGGTPLQKEHLSYITQAHDFPSGVVLVDESTADSHVASVKIQWTPRCERKEELGLKMLCFVAMDGRFATGFEFLLSKPSPIPDAPTCVYIHSLPLDKQPAIEAPYFLDPTTYKTCSEDCCACCGEVNCACCPLDAGGKEECDVKSCCFTVYARQGTRFSFIARAMGSDPDVELGLRFYFPDGIPGTVERAGISDPIASANKYGCAASLNMVLVMPYSKAVFDLQHTSAMEQVLLEILRDKNGPLPLPQISMSHIRSMVSDQKDLSVNLVEVDVLIEVSELAASLGTTSSLGLHTQVSKRLTKERLDQALVAYGLNPSVAFALPPKIDNHARQRKSPTGTTIDASMDYGACTSNKLPANVVTGAGLATQ